jgi:uncharacterized protein YdiU (UPF0061 family)
MLREYIVSEAMHGLGIPTTRSLAVAATGQGVIREEELPGAVLARVAASHLRVGTFQYAAKRGEVDDLRALADYALERHYPEANGAEGEEKYLRLLRDVVERQASLIARWMHVGFIHGVMNTDNMSIAGETIDYGPCAFLDTYDPATVFSSIDRQGRYAYGNQPYIAAWNLARFAESLLPLLAADEDAAVKRAEEAIAGFSGSYRRHWVAGMRGKLGLFGEDERDEALADDLLALMQRHRADYTNTFLDLTFDRASGTGLFEDAEFGAWRKRWESRLAEQSESEADARRLMRESNPAVIARNHRVEEALEAASERQDYGPMERLLGALSDPYAHAPEQAEFAETPPRAERPYRTYCGT